MDLGPLRRHRDYRLLFAAQLVSFLGSMVTYVAVPYQIFQLTHSSLAVGLLGVVELLPLLVTAFVGGALADAVDRRRMVLATDVGLGAASTLLALNALAPRPSVALVYTAAALLSAFNGLQRPSLEALTPRLAERDGVPATADLALLRGSLVMTAGPALGGVLIAGAGVPATYAFDVMTFVVSFAAIRLIRSMPPPETADAPSLRSVAEGFRYARSRQELIGTYVVDFVAMVFGMPLALFPALSESLGGPRVLGVLYSAPAFGALIASLTSQWTPRVKRHGLAVMLAATAWGVAIVAFGFCDRLLPGLFFLAG